MQQLILPEKQIKPLTPVTTQSKPQSLPNATLSQPKKDKISSWVDDVIKSSTDHRPINIETDQLKNNKLMKSVSKPTTERNNKDNKDTKDNNTNKKGKYRTVDFKDYITDYKSIVQ